MRLAFGFLVSICLFASVSFAQTIPSAEEVLKESLQVAGRENKNVFIIFHASWCGWCHKMDSSMNDKTVKKYFADNYVIRHLTVLESEKNIHLENPGARAFLNKYHGQDSGIPFWLIFDKEGKLLADSKSRNEGQGPKKGDNIGCPASPDEVAYFIEILRKTSRIDNTALNTIQLLFLKNQE